MTIQLQRVRGVSVTSRFRTSLVNRQPASPGRVLSTAFTIGSTAVVLAILLSRPSATTAIAMGAVVLGHALMSFAWEEPGTTDEDEPASTSRTRTSRRAEQRLRSCEPVDRA